MTCSRALAVAAAAAALAFGPPLQAAEGDPAAGVQKKVGSVQVGKQADLLVCEPSDHRDLAYYFGGNPVKAVVKKNRLSYTIVKGSNSPGDVSSGTIPHAYVFDAEGKLLAPAYMSAFHNGVLIQNHVELTGPTGWLGRAPYRAHPEKLPISLQDHGNPVRYRNIWVREL